MRRGTTPTINMTIKDMSLDLLKNIYVSLKQDGTIITKTGDDITISGSSLKITYSQEDTLAFQKGNIFLQLRATTNDGKAVASKIIQMYMEDILKEGVIS